MEHGEQAASFDDYFSPGRWAAGSAPHASELFDESQFSHCGAAESGFAN